MKNETVWVVEAADCDSLYMFETYSDMQTFLTNADALDIGRTFKTKFQRGYGSHKCFTCGGDVKNNFAERELQISDNMRKYDELTTKFFGFRRRPHICPECGRVDCGTLASDLKYMSSFSK